MSDPFAELSHQAADAALRAPHVHQEATEAQRMALKQQTQHIEQQLHQAAISQTNTSTPPVLGQLFSPGAQRND